MSDLFAILPDEEKRKIVHDVFKRECEKQAPDLVRVAVLAAAEKHVPALAQVAVDGFAREFQYERTGYSRHTDAWQEIVRKAIRDAVESYLSKHSVMLTLKDGAS